MKDQPLIRIEGADEEKQQYNWALDCASIQNEIDFLPENALLKTLFKFPTIKEDDRQIRDV